MPTTTNNPSLNFKFGLQTDLGKVSLTPGTIYVTTDERTMWVDLPVGDETKRFRLGDFISYKNKTELKNDYQNWNSSTLAYIEDTNTLAKFDGTKWVDINNFNLIQSLDARVGYEEIKDEEGSVTSEATGLFKKIKDEEDRASAKEGALETSINFLGEITTELKNKVGEPADSPDEATGLYQLIAKEEARATKAESDINDEIGDKGNDSGITATTLWAAIQEVAANAGSSETSVTALIAAEAEARAAADKILQDNIDAEEDARIEADNELNNKIDTTKTNLIGGSTHTSIKSLETALNTSIEELSNGTQASLGSLEEKINTEISNRDNADVALGGRITNEVKALNDTINSIKTGLENKINKDVSDEADAREAADEALRESLTDYVEASFATADAMTFKGVITTIADLPTGEADDEGNNKVLVNAGDTYKIGAMIASSATPEEHGVWYIGDLIIAKADQSEEDAKYSGGWYHISSGFEDDYTSYLDINDAEDTIILKDGADQSRGSITFKVPEGGSSSLNVNVSKDSTTDRSQNSTVSINLVWGTF